MHDGQLIFHTPPYSLQDISLQDVCYSTTGLKVTVNQDGSQILKKSIERPRSVTDHNKEENNKKFEPIHNTIFLLNLQVTQSAFLYKN